MDFSRIRYFCTIVETNSVTRAAELLNLSPAALSKSMKLLESEVRLKLFIPSGRGIAVTDAARAFYQKAKEIVRAVEELRLGAIAPSGQEPPLRVGSFEVFTTHFFGPLMKSSFPMTPLLLHELVAGQIEEALIDGKVDIGVTYVPIPRPELDFLKVTQIEMGLFAGKKTDFEALPVSEIPFAIPITPMEGSPNKVRGLDGWPDDIIPRNAKYQVTMMETALELCRRGLAAAFLPRFVVDLHNTVVKEAFQLQALPVPPRVKTSQAVYMVKRKTDLESRAFKKIAGALRALAPDR